MYFYDLGTAPFTVAFNLGSNGTHTDGGDLIQTVIAGNSAVQPLVTPSSGWFFNGWDMTFDNVTSDLTVYAQYIPAYTVTFDLGSQGTLLKGDLFSRA